MEDGITERVMPAIPSAARNTSTGKPVVTVRVTVNPAGNVTDANVERTFSPYFSKFALDAARRWKFIPDDRATPRHWTLRFEFTRANIQAVARRAAGE
jgi:TonB family protein